MHALFQISFRAPQVLLGELAFDGVTNGLEQQFAVDPPFDQIILRPFANRRNCQRFVIRAGEDDDRQRGGGKLPAGESFQAKTIGQAEIEEHHVRFRAFAQLCHGGGKGRGIH